MTKYYYNDPLYAAIAMRDFGVKLYTLETDDYCESEVSIDDVLHYYLGMFEDYAPPYYVGEESYRILNAQESDQHDCDIRITKRNGKLFPCPEVEND